MCNYILLSPYLYAHKKKTLLFVIFFGKFHVAENLTSLTENRAGCWAFCWYGDESPKSPTLCCPVFC